MRDHLQFSEHALDRMLDWDLDVGEIKAALDNGEIIEEYEDGSRLVLGRSGVRPLHMVIREDDMTETIFIITVYEPDPGRWDAAFRERRRP
ncbi:MAG: DUF4258 domain-containing protein [Actinomycetota bacterium]|nr:DUF4258 domain-containing protein [Actinomycetota bacterium]